MKHRCKCCAAREENPPGLRLGLQHDAVWRVLQEIAVPIIETPHDWMLSQLDLVSNVSATAKTLDYRLKRWVALTRYLDHGAVPIDKNQVENHIRQWTLGRSNWLFAGSLRRGKRVAAIMGLIQSARMNGHDPYAYLKMYRLSGPVRLGGYCHIRGYRHDLRKVNWSDAYHIFFVATGYWARVFLLAHPWFLDQSSVLCESFPATRSIASEKAVSSQTATCPSHGHVE